MFANIRDLCLAQCAVGINFVLAKYLIDNMPASVYMSYRFLLAGLFLGAWLLIKKIPLKDPQHPKLTQQDKYALIAQALTAGILFNYLATTGMVYTTATSAGIIASSLPVVVIGFSCWLLKEKLRGYQACAVLLAMLSMLILNLDNVSEPMNAQGSLWGDFLVFLAMIPEALYIIISKKLQGRVTALGAAFFANALSALLSPLLWFTEPSSTLMDWNVAPAFWWALTGSAACSVIFYWLWMRGLTQTSANTAAAFGAVMPIAASITAVFFLGEHFGMYEAIALVLVLGSLFVAIRPWQQTPVKLTIDEETL